MIRALVRKELVQHGWLLVAAMMLAWTGYGLLALGNHLREEAGSAFESLRTFLYVTLTPLCMLLGHRLVVVEYQARTQLFLEALPVSRAGMVAVKYVLGMVVLALTIGTVLLVSCALSLRHEAPAPSLVAFIACRSFATAWALYNICFAMGFLGRYRVAAYFGLLLLTFSVTELSEVNLLKFGPFVLLDERFAYEGDRLPVRALQETLGLAGVFLALAALLGLVREGSVASLLAEKMSHREKVFVAALVVGGIFLISVLGERQKKKPFDLVGAVEETRPGVTLRLDPSAGGTESAARTGAAALAEDLAGMRTFLGIGQLPPIFLMHQGDLDPDHFVRAESKESSGVRVHSNLSAPGWNSTPFRSWLLRETLIEYSLGRLEHEPLMWLLDGFSLYWPGVDHADSPLANDRAWTLRALYGTADGFSPAELETWFSFRERVGNDIAAGVAWSGLRTLARRIGPEKTRAVLAAALGTQRPRDGRILLLERRLSLERLLEAQGMTLESFLTAWREELDNARRELGDDLARIPRVQGTVAFPPISEESRQVIYQVSVAPAPSPEFDYTFLHHRLPAFDEPVSPVDLRRERHRYKDATHKEELPESLSRGARFYSTFSVKVPALGCEVISGWKREDVP